MNVDLSTVRGAAVLMAAAALRIAGNPENQGIRLWGLLAFGELQEGENTIDPVDGIIRDMLFIDGRLHGYDMARHSLTDLQPGDDYGLRDAVIPDPIIPARAENRRRKPVEDINARRAESNETGENSLCENCKCKKAKLINKTSQNQHVQ